MIFIWTAAYHNVVVLYKFIPKQQIDLIDVIQCSAYALSISRLVFGPGLVQSGVLVAALVDPQAVAFIWFIRGVAADEQLGKFMYYFSARR